MKDLTQRKQLLVDASKKLDNEFSIAIREAEERNDMELVIKRNALKRKSNEKQSTWYFGRVIQKSQREMKDYVKSDKHSLFC